MNGETPVKDGFEDWDAEYILSLVWREETDP
jgi:hypothetical protein